MFPNTNENVFAHGRPKTVVEVYKNIFLVNLSFFYYVYNGF